MKFRIKKLMLLLLGLVCAGPAFLTVGCGGYYIMTVPDQVAAQSEQIVPIARLQRNDFFVLAIAVEGSPLRFQIEGMKLERASYTDAMGYAGVSLDVPRRVGKYWLNVNLQDFEGEEFSAQAPVFVFDPTLPVVAVELESLPHRGSIEAESASAALRKISKTSNIIYLTRDSRTSQSAEHDRFENDKYPDGPVLLWQKQMWHIVREGKFKLPRIVIESRLDSQLPDLKKMFPKFEYGICRTGLARKAYREAGIKSVVVGNDGLFGMGGVDVNRWNQVEEKGLAAMAERAE